MNASNGEMLAKMSKAVFSLHLIAYSSENGQNTQNWFYYDEFNSDD